MRLGCIGPGRHDTNGTDPMKLLDRQDLADRFNVTLRTIDRWRRNGRLPDPVDYPAGGPRWNAADFEPIKEEVDKSRHLETNPK